MSHPRSGDPNDDKPLTSSTCLEDRCLGSILSRPMVMPLTHLRTILKTAYFAPVFLLIGGVSASNWRNRIDSPEKWTERAEAIRESRGSRRITIAGQLDAFCRFCTQDDRTNVTAACLRITKDHDSDRICSRVSESTKERYVRDRLSQDNF